MNNIYFHVSFEHKNKTHGTSVTYSSIKEVREAIETMKSEYDCTGIEIILDITDLIKDRE